MTLSFSDSYYAHAVIDLAEKLEFKIVKALFLPMGEKLYLTISAMTPYWQKHWIFSKTINKTIKTIAKTALIFAMVFLLYDANRVYRGNRKGFRRNFFVKKFPHLQKTSKKDQYKLGFIGVLPSP